MIRNKKEKKKKRKIVKWILLAILFAVIAFIIVTFVRLYPDYREYKANANEILMDMDENTFRREGSTYIYDKDDNLIGEIGTEKYSYVDIGDVSEYVVNGYIAQEDKKFMTHSGVDLMATTRAALQLYRNNGEITQGGSTITQQVVKNNLLTQDQTYERKILEMFLAYQLEKQYSKNQIMEFYVNSNYYGSNCYGIEGASEYYFGISAKHLTLGEAAMLVASSNSPGTCNPVVDYDGVTEKKNEVLDNMLEEGYITQEERDAAVQENPIIVEKSQNVDADNYMITYAVHCAAIEMLREDDFEFQYVFGSGEEYEQYKLRYNQEYYEALNLVRAGGYNLYTSFDTAIQAKLQESVDNGLAGFTDMQEDGRYQMQGAAACIDNDTGFVVAMVGGRGISDSYNRGYQAERQPGSAIKPLLDYAPAINEGYVTPETVVNDEQIEVNGYSPANSGGASYGNVTVRAALARSINTIAFKLFLMPGRETALSYLSAMKFSSLAYADSTVDSISIGGFTNGVTVADMAKGYYTLENNGVYTDATCLRRVVTESGETIYEGADAEQSDVFSDDTAFILTDMMQGVFKEEYGTAHKADTDAQCYAGKTGTTNDNKDAWFCGYSPYYTTVVWVGCDAPQSVEGLDGNSYPLSIWSNFMGQLHEGLEKRDFEVPETIYLADGHGDSRDVTYTSDIYYSRPEGWDYASGRLDAIYAEKEREAEIAAQIEEAEGVVAEFEEYQIHSYEEALDLDVRYNEVLSVVDTVEDESKKTELKDRAAYKYGLLSNDVVTAWADAQTVIDQQAQEEKDAQNQQAALDSLTEAQEKAEDAVRETRAKNEKVVQQYIDQLNDCHYHTSTVDTMITNAKSALENCAGYEDYDSLREQLDEAIAYAKALPTSASSSSGAASSGVSAQPGTAGQAGDTETKDGEE